MIKKIKKFLNSRLGIVLRWIFFLPFSIGLSILLTFFIIRRILASFNLPEIFDVVSGILLIVIFLTSFIYLSYKIIPAHKTRVILLVFSILIFYLIFINWETGVKIQNPSLFSSARIELKNMQRLGSDSSFVDEVYFSLKHEYLIVKIDGKYYEYCNFKNNDWNELREADSLGEIYNYKIKGRYSCDEYFKEQYIEIYGRDEEYYEIIGEPYLSDR